jgi:hypothetical protein
MYLDQRSHAYLRLIINRLEQALAQGGMGTTRQELVLSAREGSAN